MKSLIGKTTIDHIGVRHTVTAVTASDIGLTSDKGEESWVGLRTMLAHEDISQADHGLTVAQRLTCRHCEQWATDEHITTTAHRYGYVVKL